MEPCSIRQIPKAIVRRKPAYRRDDYYQHFILALERITWSMAQAGDLIMASAKRQKLGDVENELEKRPRLIRLAGGSAS